MLIIIKNLYSFKNKYNLCTLNIINNIFKRNSIVWIKINGYLIICILKGINVFVAIKFKITILLIALIFN